MSNAVYAIEQVYVDITAFEAGPETSRRVRYLPKWDYLALAKASRPRAFGADRHRTERGAARTQGIADQPALVEVVIPEKTCRDRCSGSSGVEKHGEQDYSIFGAGAAGLYTAWRCSTARP